MKGVDGFEVQGFGLSARNMGKRGEGRTLPGNGKRRNQEESGIHPRSDAKPGVGRSGHSGKMKQLEKQPLLWSDSYVDSGLALSGEIGS
jgi:hypothetical protein